MKDSMNARDLHAERQKLQKQAGLPVSEKMICDIKEAKAAIMELRYLNEVISSAEKGAPIKPAPVSSPAVKAQPAKAAAPALNRAQCEAIMIGVFREAPMTFAELSDSDLREDTLARISASGLCLTGVKPLDNVRGWSRAIRGIKQEALNRVLKETKTKK